MKIQFLINLKNVPLFSPIHFKMAPQHFWNKIIGQEYVLIKFSYKLPTTEQKRQKFIISPEQANPALICKLNI